ncbi:hypothetical protein CYMTET_54762 [Cymbomonas tetramitiformis]|uniref:Uncharacterized protein n=1 Tax=Cymbomonas tetramitiformis TaxID=36881 RepID=A0AAE0EP13_9CHLO|nr:hypothetical protein CYMTET_54762 [Cymbomonas tetramitiformis]
MRETIIGWIGRWARNSLNSSERKLLLDEVKSVSTCTYDCHTSPAYCFNRITPPLLSRRLRRLEEGAVT